MTSLRDWWRGLTLRERRLVTVMLALIAVVLLWFGIVRPVGDGLARAQADHLVAIDRAGRIDAAVGALKDASGTPPPQISVALDQLVSQSAGEAGFALDGSSAEGPDRVAISIASARPTAFFAWLAGLEARGIVVETISVQPGANNTVAARAMLKVAR